MDQQTCAASFSLESVCLISTSSIISRQLFIAILLFCNEIDQKSLFHRSQLVSASKSFSSTNAQTWTLTSLFFLTHASKKILLLHFCALHITRRELEQFSKKWLHSVKPMNDRYAIIMNGQEIVFALTKHMIKLWVWDIFIPQIF